MSFNLERKDLEILLKILAEDIDKIYAYGSRVKGSASQYSDLDLCFKGNIDKEKIRYFKSQLRESQLRFKVDLVDWNELSEEFQDLIKTDLVKLSELSQTPLKQNPNLL